MSSATNNPNDANNLQDNDLENFGQLSLRQMKDVLTVAKMEKLEAEDELQEMHNDKHVTTIKCAGILVVRLAEGNIAGGSEEGIAFKATFWNSVQPGFQLLHEAISNQEERVDGWKRAIRRMEEMRLEKSFFEHLDENDFWNQLGVDENDFWNQFG